MREDQVVGMTSNPTIFQKAMADGSAYDEQLSEVLKHATDGEEVFLALAKRDVRDACDLLRPTWERTAHLDGQVSLEVDPGLAYHGDATIAEARCLHELVDRQNLYVKIPATEPGLGAIEATIASGIAVNVTLVFSLERHRAVIEAYLRGLERLSVAGGRPSDVPSVASFFISRVDTETDRAAGRDRWSRRASWPAGDRERQAGLPAVPRSVLRRAMGRRWPRRERNRRDACGRRRRSRILAIATRCTSKNSRDQRL